MHLDRSFTRARPATRGTSGNDLADAADETLCRRWREGHDISAALQLAKRHRRIVLELAEIYRRSGLPWDDLTGEGQLGLMRAICRFDPDQGVEFSSYANWRVIVTLEEYVLKNAPRAFVRARVGDNHRRSRDVDHQSTARVQAGSGIAA
jgi:DNA-directed RNA polymerase sigma subunit (sigma70/sigma32)